MGQIFFDRPAQWGCEPREFNPTNSVHQMTYNPLCVRLKGHLIGRNELSINSTSCWLVLVTRVSRVFERRLEPNSVEMVTVGLQSFV